MSKITQAARIRCTAHTLAEQLAALRAQQGLIKEVRTVVESIPTKPCNDMQDVDAMPNTDAWGGHHARLAMRLDGAD